MSFTLTIPPAPDEDADLDNVFQQLVTGVDGLQGMLVRPRWQPVAPEQPPPGTDWCAIGVMSSTPDAYPYFQQISGPLITDPSAQLMFRHEELEVLASFYGPRAKRNSGLLRDGLQVHQNLEAIEAIDIAFTESGPARAAPDFVNQQWIRRFDVLMRFRRKISRVYAVPNILNANVHLFDDSGHVNTTFVVPPAGRP